MLAVHWCVAGICLLRLLLLLAAALRMPEVGAALQLAAGLLQLQVAAASGQGLLPLQY